MITAPDLDENIAQLFSLLSVNQEAFIPTAQQVEDNISRFFGDNKLAGTAEIYFWIKKKFLRYAKKPHHKILDKNLLIPQLDPSETQALLEDFIQLMKKNNNELSKRFGTGNFLKRDKEYYHFLIDVQLIFPFCDHFFKSDVLITSALKQY